MGAAESAKAKVTDAAADAAGRVAESGIGSEAGMRGLGGIKPTTPSSSVPPGTYDVDSTGKPLDQAIYEHQDRHIKK